MRVLDRSHFDIGILIDETGRTSWPWKMSAIGRFLPSAQRISAFGCQIGDRAFDQRLDTAAVDVDRLGTLIFPFRREQRREAGGVIVVRMGDEILPTLRKS